MGQIPHCTELNASQMLGDCPGGGGGGGFGIVWYITEKLINIVYRNAEIKKYKQKYLIVYSSLTKLANELSSWSLSCVDISWRWPPVKVKNAKHRLKTCNETMLHEKSRVFVSRISQP